MALIFFIFQILVCLGAVHASGSECNAQEAANAISNNTNCTKVVIQYFAPADRPCRVQINNKLKEMGHPLIPDHYTVGAGTPFQDFVYSLTEGPSDELYAEWYAATFANCPNSSLVTALLFMIENRQNLVKIYKQKYGKDLASQGSDIPGFKEMLTSERKTNGSCNVQKWISDIDKEVLSHSNLTENDHIHPADIPIIISFFTQEAFSCIAAVVKAWPASHNNKTEMAKSIYCGIPPLSAQTVVLMQGTISVAIDGPVGVGSTMLFMTKSVPEFIPFFVFEEKEACKLMTIFDKEYVVYEGVPRVSIQTLTFNKLLNSVIGSPSIEMMKAIFKHSGTCYNPDDH